MITNFLIIVALLDPSSIQELIDAKRWNDAEARLQTISPQQRARFEGLIAHGRGNSRQAAQAFERALVATPNVPQLNLHAAHAYLQLKQFNDVLRHAQAASALREKAIAQPLLEARAFEGLHRYADAYSVLSEACRTFSDAFRPCLELAALAQRQGLYKKVRGTAKDVLERNPHREALLALFQVLYADGDAMPILEQIVARHPEDPEFLAHLGHAYARQQRWFAAASLFERATALGGQYGFEAADQYRMAGRHREALRMNGIAKQGAPQRVQRLAILFEQEQYARIVAMKTSFEDPGSRYRIAYSHYAVGDFEGALVRTRALLETNYRDEAYALLNAMERERQP